MGLFSGLGWAGIIQVCRSSFPKAKLLSTAELDETLQGGQKQVLLLDVRKREEGAVCVGENGEAPEMEDAIRKFQNENTGQDHIIACYCSVGYRSGRLAAKLTTERNMTNVYNVEGSIFRWANEGRGVWNGERKLDKTVVHPYSAVWGALLDADKRSELA